jgi:hypothetical protein
MDAKKSRMEVSVSAIRIQAGCLDGIPFPAERRCGGTAQMKSK